MPDAHSKNPGDLCAPVSVVVGMWKVRRAKLAGVKRDARLTIRIPRELKEKIGGIDRVYGVALPKIANECLRAFCEYVEQNNQTPTFPLRITSSAGGLKGRNHAAIRRRQTPQTR